MNRTLERPSDVGVRVVAWNDAYGEDFKRINLEWIEEYFQVEASDREQLDDPRGSIIDLGGQIFFVLENDEAVATVAMIRHDAQTFELAKMGVYKSARGRGYGKLLMEAAIGFARQRGVRRVVLFSSTSLKPAMAIYEKYGFKTTRLGQDPVYARGDIEMTLELAEEV